MLGFILELIFVAGLIKNCCNLRQSRNEVHFQPEAENEVLKVYEQS
ncbi:MAG: hypothetical protein V7K62_02075 [Nostoc sp.]